MTVRAYTRSILRWWENAQLSWRTVFFFEAPEFEDAKKIIWNSWRLPQVSFLWQSAIRQNSPKPSLWRSNMHKAHVNPPHIGGRHIFIFSAPAQIKGNSAMTIFLWPDTRHCRMAQGAEALSNWVLRSLSGWIHHEACLQSPNCSLWVPDVEPVWSPF